jgi:uncharacterized protein YggL (DUF469 family)
MAKRKITMLKVRNSNFKKKRLRKKYHQKEFAEYGFKIDAKFVPDLTQKEYDDAVDECVLAVEKLNLYCFGIFEYNKSIELYITKNKGSCSDGDRAALTSAFNSIKYLKEVEPKEFFDVWRD